MNIYDVATYTIEENEVFFIDCNVLMYLCYPNGTYAATDVRDYSAFITRIIGSGAKVYITDVLLSEFVNTYIKTEFHRLARINHWPQNSTYFKGTFKATTDYADTLREVKLIIERTILPISVKINSDFETSDIGALFSNPSTFDFNDRYYSQEMARLGVSIVTNDADFSDVTGCEYSGTF